MKKKRNKNQKSEEDQDKLNARAAQVAEGGHTELTDEQRLERASLADLLIGKKEDLLRARAEREKQRREEIIELQSGKKVAVKSYIAHSRRAYKSEFGKDQEFFPQLLRICYPSANPNQFIKPPGTGAKLKQLIYDRFPPEVYPALDKLNPRLPGGKRAHKLFVDLNDDGLTKLRELRDESVDIMRDKKEGEWYEVEKELHRRSGVPYQMNMFKKND